MSLARKLAGVCVLALFANVAQAQSASQSPQTPAALRPQQPVAVKPVSSAVTASITASPAISPVVPTCQIAAAACFSGCQPGSRKTAAGACVPTELPALAVRRQAHALWEKSSAAVASESAAPAVPSTPIAPATVEPNTPACCLIPLTVEGMGYRNLGASVEQHTVPAEVYINGQLVGSTPYKDALPAGSYWVEVRFGTAPVHGMAIEPRPGKEVELLARYRLELSPQQALARTAYRARRLRGATHGAETPSQ